ncbi:uncharacterized protein LOC117057519 [Lacerta agilis]|uniref:uncharacterized protein LOC117057519 n=1 Tax=Lacerta agilis TaxID=80427 RepID=UPI0014192D85|nr:uncharacterized protein LOC117057519 [Lacerta agilis]
MASPEDPLTKEPLEEGGEKLGTKKPPKLPEVEEVKGGLPEPQGPWLQFSRGSSPSDYYDDFTDDDDDDDDPEDMFFSRRRAIADRARATEMSGFFNRPVLLHGILQDLNEDGRRRFQRKLREIPIQEGFVRIPEEALQEADESRLEDLLLSYYGATYARKVAAQALRAMGCEDEAHRLISNRGSYGMQKNERNKKVWSLEGVTITGDEMVCKGRKELLEIVEKDLEFFLAILYYGSIITLKEYMDLRKAKEDSKEKCQKLLNMIQERGEATCCWFLEQVERKHPGSIQILLAAVHGSGKKLVQATGSSVAQSESRLFAEEVRRTKMENPASSGTSVVCNLCPSEDLPETVRPEVFSDSERSHEIYRLCFTKAGSFLCLYTDVIFEVKGAVTITYHFDSWSKYLAKQNTGNWVVAGPLINIEADPAEAVAAVHFPHFLCLAGKDGSQVHIAHFVEGGISLEKPDRVGPYHVILENPNFSPRGAILKTSWFKRKIRVHTVALLYQMFQFQPPAFHLYLLPNDRSITKAVHEHEVQCPSQRIEKPPWTLKPLTIGCRFFVKTNDVRVCPKEVKFQYLDADKMQQYVELSAEQMQDMFNFSVMDKRKNELIWEAFVTQKDLKSPEMNSSPPYSEQGQQILITYFRVLKYHLPPNESTEWLVIQ